jgi:hypothetical protein
VIDDVTQWRHRYTTVGANPGVKEDGSYFQHCNPHTKGGVQIGPFGQLYNGGWVFFLFFDLFFFLFFFLFFDLFFFLFFYLFYYCHLKLLHTFAHRCFQHMPVLVWN